MAAFRFRLARVRRVRDIEEEIARSALLAAEGTLRAAERALDETRARLAQAHDAIEELQRRSPVDPRDVLAADATVRGLARRVTQAQQSLAAALEAEQRARNAWLEARRDARTLGQLETRAAANHRAERETREARETEELTAGRALLADSRSFAERRRREVEA